MPGAKPSDKGKELLGMEQVPEGFTFRREAVWAGLEAQLQPKRRRRIAFGWWAAAALLVLLAGRAWWQNPETDLPAETKPMPQQGALTGPEIPSAGEEQAAIVQATKPDRRAVVKASGRTETVVPATAVRDTILNLPVTVLAQPADSTTSMAVAAATPKSPKAVKKPRFPVAHVNELGGPPPQAPAATLPKSHTAFLLKPQQTTIEYGATDESLPARRRKSILPISSSQ